MCRSRSVGVGTVVVDVEPARVETDTHVGVDASICSTREGGESSIGGERE